MLTDEIETPTNTDRWLVEEEKAALLTELSIDKVQRPWQLSSLMVVLLLSTSLLLNVALIFFASHSCAPFHQASSAGQILYSPAQSVLVPQVKVFEGGFGLNSTIYSGPPSPETNANWEDLYNKGISRISAQEARPMGMVNKTLPIPGDENHYIVSLSVFHVLHCLNQVRLAVWKGADMSDDDGLLGITHIDHCINAIRQSLMCNADISPLVFARHPKDQRVKELMESAHSCRDFDAIRGWAHEHPLLEEFDHAAMVTSDPLGWGGLYISPEVLANRPPSLIDPKR